MTTKSAPPPAIVSYETKVKTVAAVLLDETGGIYESMLAVAQVIHNRGPDAYAVVTAHRQFSGLNKLTPAQLIRKWKPGIKSSNPGWYNSMVIARSLMKEVPVMFRLSLVGATHFHSVKVRPYWAKGKKPIAVIGGHKFYKLP